MDIEAYLNPPVFHGGFSVRSFARSPLLVSACVPAHGCQPVRGSERKLHESRRVDVDDKLNLRFPAGCRFIHRPVYHLPDGVAGGVFLFQALQYQMPAVFLVDLAYHCRRRTEERRTYPFLPERPGEPFRLIPDMLFVRPPCLHEHETRKGGIGKFTPGAELLLVERHEVMVQDVDERIVPGLMRLYEHLAQNRTPPRSSGDLRQQLKRPFGRAEIGDCPVGGTITRIAAALRRNGASLHRCIAIQGGHPETLCRVAERRRPTR